MSRACRYVAFVVEGRHKTTNEPQYRVVVFALQSSADAVALANIVFKQCYEAVRLYEQAQAAKEAVEAAEREEKKKRSWFG